VLSDIGFIDSRAVLFRSHVIFFSENAVEVRKIGHTYISSNFRYLHTGGDKQIGGNIQTIIVDILDTGHTHIFFEETHKVMFAEIDLFGKFINSDGACIVFTDVVKNDLDISGSAVFYDCLSVSAFKEVAEQDKKQSVKLRFDFYFKEAFLYGMGCDDLTHTFLQFFVMVVVG